MKLFFTIILTLTTLLLACGPFFDDKILQDRAGTLRYLPSMEFRADLHFLADFSKNPGIFNIDSISTISEEFLWVEKKHHTSLIAARSAHSEFELQEAVKLLPQNLATYLNASYIFNHTKLMRSLSRNSSIEQSRLDPHQTYRALILYNSLITMDKMNKEPITVRAMFMKGRCFQRLLMRDSADACFKKVELMAKQGASDRLNLTWESTGEQGAIAFQRKNHIKALELYISQIAALGPITPSYLWNDTTAIDSTKRNYIKKRFFTAAGSIELTLDEIFRSDSLIEIACKQPAMEFLIASYLYNTFPAFESHTMSYDDDSTKAMRMKKNQQYCKIIANAPIHSPRAADRFAAAAYRFEHYDLATKLTKNSSSSLGWWIRGKLAIQRKDMNRAAYCYTQAIQLFKSEKYHDRTTWKGDNTTLPQFDSKQQYIQPLVESAVLSVVRGDFTTALSILYSTTDTLNSYNSYWDDIAYLAERLITTNQLKSLAMYPLAVG